MKRLTDKELESMRLCERYITCREVANILEIDPDAVQRKAVHGELPGFKLMNKWHFDPERLATWLRRIQRTAEDENIPVLRALTKDDVLPLREALGCGKGTCKLYYKMRHPLTGELETYMIPDATTTVVPAEFLESEGE